MDLYTTHLPMTVFCAARGHAARLVRQWLPDSGGLALELDRSPGGGSAVFPSGTALFTRLVGMVERSALVEYRKPEAGE